MALPFDPLSPTVNPPIVKVAYDGGPSGSFTFEVHIAQSSDGSLGDMRKIGLGDVTMTLTPVGPGSAPTFTKTISYPTVPYTGEVVVTFAFSGVPVNCYDVMVSFSNTNLYYRADNNNLETVLTVYDPSLGFTTGGGWFYWPGTTDKTNFGYVMQYGKNGVNLKGNLLLIRHLANGDIIRIKSNSLNAGSLTLGTNDTPMGWASFSGKCTYTVVSGGIATSVGNVTFKVYVEDRSEPGTGVDRFWIQVNEYPLVTLNTPQQSNAVALNGGNIVVPHTPARTTKGGWLLVLATPTWMASWRKRASDSRHENQRLEG